MAENTEISWTDATFNPWIGCTKVSTAATGGGGCDHCYAEVSTPARVMRAKGAETWGAGAPRVRTTAANWRKPLAWNKEQFVECRYCGLRGIGGLTGKDNVFSGSCPSIAHGMHWVEPARRRVFCASLADVFDNEVPQAWRQDLMSLIARTPNLDWLLLTKRIGNARRMLSEASMHDGLLLTANDEYRPPANLWLGATIVNQEEADRDIPKLLATPARVRFLSMEPLLGPVDPTQIDDGTAHRDVPREEWGIVDDDDSPPGLWWNVLTGERTIMHGGATGDWSRTDAAVDWVIVGGESGQHARPMHPDWARSLRDQCAAAGVPFHFKQVGDAVPVETEVDGDRGPTVYPLDAESVLPGNRYAIHRQGDMEFVRVGKKAAGRLLDGKTHDAFPEVLP